ncbi:MAG: hypothetical protein WCE69_07805 [Aestuariivirga sp.]
MEISPSFRSGLGWPESLLRMSLTIFKRQGRGLVPRKPIYCVSTCVMRWTGTKACRAAFPKQTASKLLGVQTMRGILLWMIGLPIPVIILLYLFHVI